MGALSMDGSSVSQVPETTSLRRGRKIARQARSKRSAQIALAATCELLREREAVNFTLHDVSQRSKVSIGSIINSFDFKDNLIRAAVLASLDEYDAAERSSVESAALRSSSLRTMVQAFVDIVASGWAVYGIALKSVVLIAKTDPVVESRLKSQTSRSEQSAVKGILEFRHEIAGRSPEIKAQFVNNIVRTFVSSVVGSNHPLVGTHPSLPSHLRDQLTVMCLCFLKDEQA